ncbi:MAG: hypothetical protein RLZZ578_1779 [Bacteroidota bacterium]|jgi:ABC-2 type transport system permease protein
MHLLRLWLTLFRNCLSRDFEFRLHYALQVFVDIVWCVVQIAFFEVMFMYTPAFGGLSKSEAYIFLGTLFIVDSLNMTLIASNFWHFPRHVNTGELDFFLLKPVSPLFLSFFRFVNTASIVNVTVSIFIFCIGITMHDQSIHFIQWIGWIFGIICGSIVLFSFEAIVGSMSFYFVNASGVQSIFYALYQIAMRPDGIYSGFFRRLFITIFPLSLIASVPASMLYSDARVEHFIMMIGVSSLCVVGAAMFFSRALKQYNGASG